MAGEQSFRSFLKNLNSELGPYEFPSPSPPLEEKGPGDEETGKYYLIAAPGGLPERTRTPCSEAPVSC
jgi:hypothetical protein